MIAREKIIERSAAEFFEANKAIAGFDNPTRSTYTSIRELVENALDAAEKGGFLPDIQVKIELMTQEEIGSLMGIKDYKYGDETVIEFIRLTVKDNGIGIYHSDIPKLFGRVLTGSNYGERQSRGRFGLGAKMVLIYSQSTLRIPFEVKSRQALSKKKDEEFTSHYKLFIDIVNNAPEIVDEKKYTGTSKNQLRGHGTEITVCFAGTWSRAKRYVLEYFDQMAVITPYASFLIITPDNPDQPIIHKKTIDVVPPLPIEVPLHPVGTDINQLKSEITRTNAKNMVDFLKTHFQRIGDKTAAEVLNTSKISPKRKPSELDEMELRRLMHEGFAKVRFFPPDGKCLSPLNFENLEAGLKIVFKPEFTCSEGRPPSSYSGHAFQVELAIGYGGEQIQPPYKLVRFANRIPLLFGEGNDLIKKTIEEINWSNYKTNLTNDPLVFAVSIVSTKIPFPETSKEYIAEVDEIRKELRLCLQKAGRKLMSFQRALKKKQLQAKRMKIFEKYAPVVTSIVSQLLGKMDEEEFPFLFSSTQFTNCLKNREGSILLPKNPIPIEALPMDSIEGVNLERYDIQTLQDLVLLDEKQLQELISLGLSEEAVDQAQQILQALLDLPELAKDELVESASLKAINEFAKEKGILDGMQIYTGIDTVTTLPSVGPATQKVLNSIGIKTVKDFFLKSNEELEKCHLNLTLITEIKSKCNVDVLPNLQGKTVEALHKNKIYTVLDFLETKEGSLIKFHGLSKDRVADLVKIIRKNLDLEIEELVGKEKGEKVDRVRIREEKDEDESLDEDEEGELIEEEEIKEEVEFVKIKEEEKELPPPPQSFLDVDAPINTLEGVGKTMAQRLIDKGIDNVGKFYMANNNRLLKIKGLGDKTITVNRGNTDVIVLPHITLEGKHDLNLMGIYTVKEFLDAEDDALTSVRGIRLPTVTKLKLSIEEKLLVTPGSITIPKSKPAKKSKEVKPSLKEEETTSTEEEISTPPLKTSSIETKKMQKVDKSMAEFLGTKQPKSEEEEPIASRISGPPKGFIALTTKISQLPGFTKKLEDSLSNIGVKTVLDLFKKDISKLTLIESIDENNIIEIRKMLSIEVLPHISPSILANLNAIGIYTIKQFHNAKIAKTSSVKGLGVKTVKNIRNHIIRALKTSVELEGSVDS